MQTKRMNTAISFIVRELNLSEKATGNVINLLDDGATIPFIARYRKELTSGMDEVQIEQIDIKYSLYKELEKRKKTILESINNQELLTDELKERIELCFDKNILEDIYLPYKPKKRTRAAIAREKGLEPLAKIIMKQNTSYLETSASSFVSGKVYTVDEAIGGACDIIAEWANEDALVRDRLRGLFKKEALISSKVAKDKEEEAVKYQNYFDFEELSKKSPSHRILAMLRGEKEGLLKLNLAPDKGRAIEIIDRKYVRSSGKTADVVHKATSDAYTRLLKPSLGNELMSELKQKAEETAISVFARNLEQLLLSPPLGSKRVLSIDPGFRTGCKVVCLDERGELLHNETIYPHSPQNDRTSSMKKINSLVDAYKIESIAIGNGTAGRETEALIKKLKFSRSVSVYMVNEDGASVYSASKEGREEFPKYDVTVRGAVSIGRRLMNPLAELVKIEPKSIGVGQYQHDVDAKKLEEALDNVVEFVVNRVGVDLNTASKYLLARVAGLNKSLAENIVKWRKENGGFSNRTQLLEIPGLGDRKYEQCAGFLRVVDGDNILDSTTIHPESYAVVKEIATQCGSNVESIIGNEELLSKVNLSKLVADGVGEYTAKDIIEALKQPIRDPRRAADVLEFTDGIDSIADLREGMIVNGIVTNITQFGAFVDLGIKENGLVHISQLADRYVADPMTVVAVNQHVKARVLSIDSDKKRISLSMRGLE
ncbi:MAG: Tex family protein [Bacteroidales bacterium]